MKSMRPAVRLKTYRKVCLTAVLLLLTAVPAAAHPHMSIGSRLTFEYDGRICRGFWVEWTFDEFFSVSVIEDYDKDKDGKFDEAETKDIYNTAFINLENYGYFILLREGDRRYSPDRVTDFSASYRGDELTYKFFVPLKKSPENGEIFLAVFDRTYFCATGFEDNPVTIKQKSGKAPVFEISENRKYPVYYNPYGSTDDNTVYSKWKEGLETAYPEEVHVHFADKKTAKGVKP